MGDDGSRAWTGGSPRQVQGRDRVPRVRVVHVIPSAGAAYRLHVGLRRLGTDSRMFVLESRIDDPYATTFLPPGDLFSRVRRRLRRGQLSRSMARYRSTRPAGYGWFFDDRSIHGGAMLDQLPPCDLVHLHATAGFVDYRAFFASVPRRVPVVRTLHDMAFFTGGCHHDWGCGKYTARCGACPQLGSHAEEDLSRQIWRRKHAALGVVPPGRLYCVTPSRWLAETAKRSALLRDVPISVIPLGVDTEQFRPRDRRAARDILGVPQDALAVLFLSDPIDRAEKGFVLLAQALDALGRQANILLVSVGGGALPCKISTPHLRLERIHHERMLSMIYSAADLCVIPSVQDNFPYVALESLACGTPVVAFAVGGLPESVRPGITGRLVPPRDAGALGAAIRELLEQPAQRMEMGAQGRRVAVEEYALELQAQRYLALYETILGAARKEEAPAEEARPAAGVAP